MGSKKSNRVVVGDKFARWTVMSEPFSRGKALQVNCTCECGGKSSVPISNLVLGKSKSCGCLAREVASARGRHWKSGTKVYAVWRNMLTRCGNPKADRYNQYGGRGIAVCDEWLTFDNFYSDMGDIPGEGCSIGRVDNDKGYCKENCRWETAVQQQNNTSRNRMVDINGEVMTVKQASDLTGVPYSKLIQRARAGATGRSLVDHEDKNEKLIAFRGIELRTTEWFAVLGIPISSFYHHRRRGLSSGEVLAIYAEKNGFSKLSDSEFSASINLVAARRASN